jgi:2-keto-4-pentenoate hydratase/2-oxohepta-3-ene-1,7-dioic acid hydratase in catechol pathway
MKLCTFVVETPLGRQRRVGVVAERSVIDATAAREALLERQLPASAAERVASAQVPPDLIAIIGSGALGLEWVAEAVEHVSHTGAEATGGGKRIRHDLQATALLAPIPHPPGIACFTTWKAHIEDSAGKGFALKFPEEGSEIRPYYKGNPDSVSGPGAVLELPCYAKELDVECELAAVVGVGGKDLSVEQARAVIAGYCIFNDVSVREIQVREMQTGLGPTKGKDQDGGNVLGPWLVTADEVGDPRGLEMSLHVNGEKWSGYQTRHMAWEFADLLSYLSRGQTVRPGHIVTSGCYPGGSALDLGRKLRRGDLVELRISKLGSLANRIAHNLQEEKS